MSAWFGVGGSLFEVKCPASANRSSERAVSFTRTLGGKRKGFIGRGVRRSWSIDTAAASPLDVSTLETLASVRGQVSFIPPEAAAGNVISPRASGFESIPGRAADAGLVALPDGSAARAISRVEAGAIYVGSPDETFELVPVRGGTTIQFGVWATEASRATLSWRDGTGAALSSTALAQVSGTGWSWRPQAANVPANAAFVGISFSVSSLIARPSLSWGPTAANELGSGCPRAVLHGAEYSPVILSGVSNYTSLSYSVTEVG